MPHVSRVVQSIEQCLVWRKAFPEALIKWCVPFFGSAIGLEEPQPRPADKLADGRFALVEILGPYDHEIDVTLGDQPESAFAIKGVLKNVDAQTMANLPVEPKRWQSSCSICRLKASIKR